MLFGTILTIVFQNFSEIVDNFREKRIERAMKAAERERDLKNIQAQREAQREAQKRTVGGEIEIIEVPANRYVEVNRNIDRMIVIISPGATAKIATFQTGFQWEVQQGCAYLSVLYDAEGKTSPKAIKKEDRLDGYSYTIQTSTGTEHIVVPREDYRKFVYLLVHNPIESNVSVEFSFERIFN